MAEISPVVVDTSVVSIIHNGGQLSEFYENAIEGRRPLISFQTLEEMWYGAFSGNWGDRRQEELRRHLDLYEVVWSGPELVRICARLRSQRKSMGREMTNSDAWIAATAILIGCPLVSDDKDFADIPNLEVIRAPLWLRRQVG